jgi:hypothetical protein
MRSFLDRATPRLWPRDDLAAARDLSTSCHPRASGIQVEAAERPSPSLLSDGIEASRTLALFLAKNHNLCHAFFSRRMSPALGKRGTRKNERCGQSVQTFTHNLRWMLEIFLV